jgi:hypothetical protein
VLADVISIIITQPHRIADFDVYRWTVYVVELLSLLNVPVFRYDTAFVDEILAAAKLLYCCVVVVFVAIVGKCSFE